MKTGTRTIILSVLVAFLVSCNADVFSRIPSDYEGSGSKSETSAFFTGAAPQNISASQAFYTDTVILMFDPVPGADYYEIYRAKSQRDIDSVDETSLEWFKLDHDIENPSGKTVIYRDTIAQADRIDYRYHYKVRAGSNIDYGNSVSVGEFSNVVEGWTLAPPSAVNATQGEYTDRVKVTWPQTDLVKGYLLYVLNSNTSSWDLVNQDVLIPYSYGKDEISYDYYMDADYYGKDLYFRVSSVSSGNVESSMSVIRNGYTYVKGAPDLPTGVIASKGDYKDRIEIAWDKSGMDESGSGYVWEVYRGTAASDSVLVISFNAQDLKDPSKIPDGLSLENGKYKYIDPASSSVVAGETYTYTIRAISKITDEETQQEVDAIGKAASVDGSLMAPPKNISIKAILPEAGSSGAFEFSCVTPLGFTESKGWQYVLYGRYDDGFTEGEYGKLGEFAVDAEKTDFTYYFDPLDMRNEFAISLIDGTGTETDNTETLYSIVLSADAVSVDDIVVKSNSYSSSLTANENGVYPVYLSVGNQDAFKTITVSVTTQDGVTESKVYSIDDLKNSGFAVKSPEKPFEKYSYTVSGESWFGRKTKTSKVVEAYGAVTPEKFIKLFEAYAMKPWEFVEKPDFPDNLKTKWAAQNDSSNHAGYLHWKIDRQGTDSLGSVSVNSEYHGGVLEYRSSMNGFAGDVNFKLTNFGELEEIWSNGSYAMIKVEMDGHSNTVNGTVTVSGMYPATVDFNSLKVSGYAFAGNYNVTFSNELGSVSVAATRN